MAATWWLDSATIRGGERLRQRQAGHLTRGLCMNRWTRIEETTCPMIDRFVTRTRIGAATGV